MSSLKQLKQEEKSLAQQRQIIIELNALVKDIERSEKTISALDRELGEVNSQYRGPRNTRQDIAYLTALLDCAKKKLAWEKQIASLQKRTPVLLEQMAGIMKEQKNPLSPENQAQMLRALQSVQSAMQRLQNLAPAQPASQAGEPGGPKAASEPSGGEAPATGTTR